MFDRLSEGRQCLWKSASNTVDKLSNGQYSLRDGLAWLSGDADRTEARKFHAAPIADAEKIADSVQRLLYAGH